MLRASLDELKGLLEWEPYQRGSAPGNAPVQSKGPSASRPEKPTEPKKKVKFRLGATGDGEVEEGKETPEQEQKRLAAKMVELYKLAQTLEARMEKHRNELLNILGDYRAVTGTLAGLKDFAQYLTEPQD